MILLSNCLKIATFNDLNDELTGYDILIEDNIIQKIGKDIKIPNEVSVREIDCSKYLIIPGMINCHHHFYQTLTRNLPGAQDAKLFEWLTYLYPIWAGMDSNAIYYSTLLATAELLKTGATTSSDHMYLYPADFDGDIMELQFEAAEKTGIRFYPTRGSMTRGQSSGGLPPDNVVQTTDEVVRDMERVIDKYHNSDPLSMRKIILAPCSPFSVDEELMIRTAELARDKGVNLHTHLAETEDEEEYCIEKYGKRPLDAMADWNWLGDDVFFAHGIWFDDRELNILSETKPGICHCPSSNMRLGSGIARVREMLDMGISVGLGVDGSSSNDSSDMLGETRNAMLIQRIKYGSSGLSAREALRMATRGGSQLMNSPQIGSIEEGKAADLAIFNMDSVQFAGALSDPLTAIVFSGYNHQTEYTIVNGNIVVENGQLITYNENTIIEKANEISLNLVNKYANH